ncbi:MAG: alpha-amylase family protein, partial [Acetobacteraceae bacterium]
MATLRNEIGSVSPPPAAEPDVASAPSQPADVRSPRIYYLHPLLAGPLGEWGRHFDRIARLGFDHVLIAPVFQPGRTGSILLAADYDRLHPALGWSGDAASGLRRFAELARADGLTPLLDLVADRIAADAELANTSLFRAAGEFAPLDPRRYPSEAES